jgi:hypothetical protein
MKPQPLSQGETFSNSKSKKPKADNSTAPQEKLSQRRSKNFSHSKLSEPKLDDLTDPQSANAAFSSQHQRESMYFFLYPKFSKPKPDNSTGTSHLAPLPAPCRNLLPDPFAMQLPLPEPVAFVRLHAPKCRNFPNPKLCNIVTDTEADPQAILSAWSLAVQPHASAHRTEVKTQATETTSHEVWIDHEGRMNIATTERRSQTTTLFIRIAGGQRA